MHQAQSSPPLDERQVEWLLAVAFVQFVLSQIGVADKTKQSGNCSFVVLERTVIAVVAVEPVVVEMGRPFGESTSGG